MKTPKYLVLAGFLTSLVIAAPAWAGAELKIDDESSINLGFRVQAYTVATESDLNGDGSFDSQTDFRVRRARLRLLGKVNPYISAFIQTEFADDAGGSGGDMRVIDAFVNLKYNNWAQLYAGQNMAPSSRQATTSSGAMMAIDRPGNNTKNLTWGARSLGRFSTTTIGDTNDPAIFGDNAVRDMGMTFFGSGSFNDTTHLKYYLGFYDGVQNATGLSDKNLRMTTRAQLNLFDSEAGYYNSSTYLGKKKTLGFGVSYDTQDDVQDATAGGTGDYTYFSVDAFAEWPMGDGTLTAEAAFSDLDLDGATANALRAEGDGWYVQAGYYINQWQPWVELESWDSNTTNGLGDYDAYRIGISYFLKGHNANIKLGYESFDPDINFSGTNEDSLKTILLGIYVTY